MDPKRQYLEAARAKFLLPDSADAWLIAYAAHEGGFKIITNEDSAPNSKTSVKIPDVAAAMGIQTIRLPVVLQQHAVGNFAFKP